MLSILNICAIAGLIVALILGIIIWTLVGIEYKKLLKQRKIDRLIERIRERAEDSGNESDGDTEELSALVEMGNYNLGFDNNL
uniref:Protein Vpu n=1 Tax=Human immunodeficiency virus type 1 TaxID=11676 RepID=B5LQD9_HV1|nr:vpu protein [Human immunodeficiency virus 1]ACH47889.1 vpu protein [Human immunodeficiency virus 1]ACH47891.1 vpu protein [Human immunodeficiency virus 1]ACH47895.1 vpu protein [Human immunodeficiency virus 1]ACH47897.1 vpu protein [Human immunodeficiency virus 1]